MIVLPVTFLGFSSANDMTYIEKKTYIHGFFSPRETSGRKKAGTGKNPPLENGKKGHEPFESRCCRMLVS
jgi:hypothetical protein